MSCFEFGGNKKLELDRPWKVAAICKNLRYEWFYAKMDNSVVLPDSFRIRMILGTYMLRIVTVLKSVGELKPFAKPLCPSNAPAKFETQRFRFISLKYVLLCVCFALRTIKNTVRYTQDGSLPSWAEVAFRNQASNFDGSARLHTSPTPKPTSECISQGIIDRGIEGQLHFQ